MAYNLPPAWDPGFVLPKNVRDEGLERRAFITKMLPRGSYSQPKVGTGGYAVPQYVEDEGYGQGTYTTYWQPGGTYNGPRIPHYLNRHPKVTKAAPLPGGGHTYTIQTSAPAQPALSDDEPLHPVFEDYGQKAAQMLIARVAPLPQSRRSSALRQILDKVDRSLWSRTQTIWNRYVAQGRDPGAAFQQALARAMSTGIAAEIIHAGLQGAAPQANSLLGLGCYGGRAALGATGDASGCRTQPGYSWVYGATVSGTPVAGHWERTVAGQPDVPFCATPPAGAKTVAAEVAAGTLQVGTGTTGDVFSVGPFLFHQGQIHDQEWDRSLQTRGAPDLMYISPDINVDVSKSLVSGSPVRPIESSILAWLGGLLKQATDANGKTSPMVHYNDPGTVNDSMLGKMNRYWPSNSDADRWFAAMGISPTTPIRTDVAERLHRASGPFGAIQDKNGTQRLLMVILERANWNKPWDPAANPVVLKVWLTTPHKSGGLYQDIAGGIMSVVNPIASTIGGALDDLGGLACSVLNAGNGAAGKAAGAAAATAAGAPPSAGVAGAAIAQNACGTPPPAPAPTAVAPARISILPLAILGGAGVLAVLLMSGGRRQAP